jgi:hypothetical protein
MGNTELQGDIPGEQALPISKQTATQGLKNRHFT